MNRVEEIKTKAMAVKLGSHPEDIPWLLERMAEMQLALEFYAEGSNYSYMSEDAFERDEEIRRQGQAEEADPRNWPVFNDRGEIARQALFSLTGEK